MSDINVEEIKTGVKDVVTEALGSKADAKDLATANETIAAQAQTIASQGESIKSLESTVDEVKNIAADVESKIADKAGTKQVEMTIETHMGAINSQLKSLLTPTDNGRPIGLKALTIDNGSGDNVAFAIDEQLGRTIIERARENVAILGQISVKNVGSVEYREMVLQAYPKTDKGAEQVTGANWTLTDTQSYVQVKLQVAKQYAKPQISHEAASDPHIDIYAHLVSLLADEMSRYWAIQVIGGDGTDNNLRGILGFRTDKVEGVKANGVRNVEQYPIMFSGAAGSIGDVDPTAAGSAIDNAIDLTIMVPSKYLSGSKFLMNRRVLGEYRKLKDLEGRPMIQFEAGGFSLVGYPVVIEDYWPDVAADSYPVLFGDLSKAFALCNIDDHFLVDPYSVDGATVIKNTSRKGDIVQNNDAIALLCAAVS